MVNRRVVLESWLLIDLLTLVVFFFQAEDGIRDVAVTGVQTCALPICFVNSLRVSFFSNSPQKAEVVVTEFCFCTPRIITQRWAASMTTATPSGLRVS